MPIAAVPEYMGRDFRSAPPALRFGMYLKLWGADWKRSNDKKPALDHAVSLTPTDRKAMEAFAYRQMALFEQTGTNGLRLAAISVAPFTTGLGNEHPLENGFSFLNPYGLPYLPGSSVKGVLRRAAEELAHENFFKDGHWTLPAIWHLFGFEQWPTPQTDEAAWYEWVNGFGVGSSEIGKYLDGLDKQSGITAIKKKILHGDNPLHKLMNEKGLHVQGALKFWDVVPKVNGKDLKTEIMTPHYSHYYREGENGGESPHDSGSPNPICFLTVPPDSSFTFHVICDQQRLERTAPELIKDGVWKDLLNRAFEHAYQWLGFGAKTAVGYGAMKIDPQVKEEATRKAEEKAADQKRQEEKCRQLEAEKAAADRRQAEKDAFDALPESRKRLIKVEQALTAFQKGMHSEKEALSNEAKDQAKKLTMEAPSWPDAAEREEAAKLLEKLYEGIGWHDPRRTKKQRERQIKKKRDAIAKIRGDG